MTPAGLKDRALQIQVTIEGWYLGWSEAEVGLGSGTSTCCSSRSHFGSVFLPLSFKRSVKQTPFSITSEWGVLRQSPNSSPKDYWASSKHLSLVGGSLCLLHISRSCSCWETFTLRKECSECSSVTVRMVFNNCWLTSVGFWDGSGGFSTSILNLRVLVGMQSLGMSITKAEREQREAAGHSRPVVTSKAAERHRLRQDVYIYIWTLNGG